MRFYSFGYSETQELEVKHFWFLNRQLERLRAEEQIFQMRTNGSLTTAEGFEKTYDHYLEMVGVVATYDETPKYIDLDENTPDPAFDRKAFLALKESLEENR